MLMRDSKKLQNIPVVQPLSVEEVLHVAEHKIPKTKSEMHGQCHQVFRTNWATTCT